MFGKYVDTLRLSIQMLLPHWIPETVALNNIFGGEGARRFQPQDSITLFLFMKKHRDRERAGKIELVPGSHRGR